MFKRLLARILGRKNASAPGSGQTPLQMPPPPPPHSSKVVVGAPAAPAPPRRLRLIKGGTGEPAEPPAEALSDASETSTAPTMTTEAPASVPPSPPQAPQVPAPAADSAGDLQESSEPEGEPLPGPRIRLVFDDGSDDEVTDLTPGGMRIRYLADNLLSDGDAR